MLRAQAATEPGGPDDERLQLPAGLLDTPGPATTTPVGCPRWIRIAGGIAAHTRQDTELVKEIAWLHAELRARGRRHSRKRAAHQHPLVTRSTGGYAAVDADGLAGQFGRAGAAEENDQRREVVRFGDAQVCLGGGLFEQRLAESVP
jgi:hypothetical protein